MGFYGELVTQKRPESWAKLRQLKNRRASPWLCAGDFNEITWQSEKSGRRPRPHCQMQRFRDVVDECAFMDLGFVGFPFTWHKHFVDYIICEWLDRALATNEWFNMFFFVCFFCFFFLGGLYCIGFKESRIACCGTGPYRGMFSCGGKRSIKIITIIEYSMPHENCHDIPYFEGLCIISLR